MSKSNSLRDIFHKNGLTYSEVGNPDGTIDPTYVSMGLDGFNEAITQIIALVDSEVIGADIRGCDSHDTPTYTCSSGRCLIATSVNGTKDQMRANLKKLMGKK